jgi:uncharacterized protein YraI
MTKVLRIGTAPLVALAAMLFTAISSFPIYAQSDDLIGIGAGPSRSSIDSSIYGDKFKEAERALLEGLTNEEAPTVRTVSAASLAQKTKPPVERISPPSTESVSVGELAQTSPKAETAAKLVPAKAVTAERKLSTQSSAVTLLQGKLTASELRARELEQQLSEAKSQLSAAEVEINRLSGIISGGARARLSARSAEAATRIPAPVVNNETSGARQKPILAAYEERRPIAAEVAPPSPSQSLQVATVAVDKAELRLGPGKNHSALMAIPRGSRLAVEVRQGEWYRVFAPTGERAWIQSSLVRFGEGAASMNDGSSVKVRGYDVSVEQQAFRRASALTSGK